MYIYEFHVHTKYSPDSDVKLSKLYKVLKKHNISGIAITDHNTIDGAMKFKEKYGNKIDVIVGEEIMTTEGEIIGLFLKEKVEKGLTPRETIEKIKNQDGIVYIPHPFDSKRYKTCLKENIIKEYSDSIDIIEIFNGRCIDRRDVKKSELLNNSLNKIGVIASDAHSYYELKFNCMILNNKITRKNINSQLRQMKVLNMKINKSIHQYTKFVKLKKIIKEGKFNEAFELIYRKCRKRFFKISTKNSKG
ncbi:PHP domain-containing protein [Haloimpatiens massiliensis]|uniref:PHP domain-containing protein n=1 Tax=Haloimpatiens massiliensis TaxID=1658110 RepID=UPI000C82FAB8|nr:PHP domain-containing protein [Haloimpatiens massiliensis]